MGSGTVGERVVALHLLLIEKCANSKRVAFLIMYRKATLCVGKWDIQIDWK